MTNEEILLKALMDSTEVEILPQNNTQAYLAYLNGVDIELSTPRTNEEVLLYNLCINGIGGGSSVSDGLIITQRDENGSPLVVDASNLSVLHEAQFYSGRANSPWYKTKTFVLSDNVTELPEYVFAYCNGIESFVIPFGVLTIEQYAFVGCKSMESITFGRGVVQIGSHAFDDCTALSEITFSKNLHTISQYAFRNCSSLTSVTIPKNVENIDSYAFMGCSKLATVTFEGTPAEISGSTFLNVTSITDIYVPWAEGAVSGAPWGATNATVHYGG